MAAQAPVCPPPSWFPAGLPRKQSAAGGGATVMFQTLSSQLLHPILKVRDINTQEPSLQYFQV